MDQTPQDPQDQQDPHPSPLTIGQLISGSSDQTTLIAAQHMHLQRKCPWSPVVAPKTTANTLCPGDYPSHWLASHIAHGPWRTPFNAILGFKWSIIKTLLIRSCPLPRAVTFLDPFLSQILLFRRCIKRPLESPFFPIPSKINNYYHHNCPSISSVNQLPLLLYLLTTSTIQHAFVHCPRRCFRLCCAFCTTSQPQSPPRGNWVHRPPHLRPHPRLSAVY